MRITSGHVLLIVITGVALLGVGIRLWSDRILDRLLTRLEARGRRGLYLIGLALALAASFLWVENRGPVAWMLVAAMLVGGLASLYLNRGRPGEPDHRARDDYKLTGDQRRKTASIEAVPSHRDAMAFISRVVSLDAAQWARVLDEADIAKAGLWRLLRTRRARRALGRVARGAPESRVVDDLQAAVSAQRAYSSGSSEPDIRLRDQKLAIAEEAALALMLRGRLSTAHFATLYRPFARVVPLHSLGLQDPIRG
jgi:hypothetical protein